MGSGSANRIEDEHVCDGVSIIIRVRLCQLNRDSVPSNPRLGADELGDLVLRQLQDCACQITVGEPKFVQNREVVCLRDRD
jgi:hypothetical protein